MDVSSLVSFGEIIKAYRKRQGLTRQQLSRKLAIHYNTIGAWERGDYLPATRDMVLKLARCLYLDESETHFLLDASLTDIAVYWNIPYQRNPFFVGRQETLEQLHRIMSGEQDGSASRACALSGLGGIGKTQTAIEYAYRHSLDFSAVFWINVQTEETIMNSFASIAEVLNLSVYYEQQQDAIIPSVLDWLNTHQGWLLIFDNLHDSELIKRYLPSSWTGSLLFTTRLPTVGILALSMELESLTLEESKHLLLQRAGIPSSHSLTAEDEKALQVIAEKMDGLPLALDQVAAYIKESRSGLVCFLHSYMQDAIHILREHSASMTYPYSVERTFSLAFECLQRQCPVSADLLLFCCFLSPDDIPETLLTGVYLCSTRIFRLCLPIHSCSTRRLDCC